ncbi:hypothetical protein FP371_21320 [Citrobacter freundii]|uniref:hypothetical protein n=1 Tax=Citrobacter freundii TaxID=546 RepID=UPI001BCB50C7|nr:hypothetical protein [Citrobacter freundii]MBY5300758.1 hypothetical protein [Citrobacter freundii]
MREYQYFQSLGPEQQKTYMRVRGRTGAEGLQQAQLSNGETVMIEPKPRGAGANMFYPGIDANGNVISVPVSSLAATSDTTSATNQNLISSDLSKITNAKPDQLSVLTGVTGGVGENPITSDIRTRFGDKETRDIYRSMQRVQGYMLKQGVSDAKNMGASGINTAAEAKMYFQAAPQLDMSSPDAMLDSAKALDDYTKAFNSKHNVNYKKNSQQQSSQQPATHTSKSGIQFTVE